MKLARLWGSIASLFGFRKPVILGQELARAETVERRRLLRRDLAPSPMPDGTYRQREACLVDPVEQPLDAAIRDVVRAYRAAGEPARASMRDAISMDEIYTLFTFARRAAVFGMRGRDRSWIEDGLAAVAMLDLERMDPRDLGLVVVPLHHAALRVGAEAKTLFDAAAQLAQPAVADALRQFPDADATTKDLYSWLLEETATGFIDRGLGDEEYAPTRDLQAAIVEIAAIVDSDRYELSSVSIADSLPAAWIPGSEPLLRNALGGALVHAGHEKTLMVFLVELPDAATATALRDAAGRAETTASKAVAGIARGNLFCLVVASPVMLDETIDETPQTLQRFVAPIEKILDTVL